MLSGKKFPQNVRAMRIVVKELPRSTLQHTYITTNEDLMATVKKNLMSATLLSYRLTAS